MPLEPPAASPVADSTLQPYSEQIPSTLIEIEMVPVPAGSVTIETPDGPQEVEVNPFWIAKTEVTWDAYDVYVYELDKEEGNLGELDAVSRPSKPYVLPGEDFGHDGYPALAMTRQAAEEYGRWLSARTGKNYRLPTEAEWQYACQLGQEAQGSDEETLDAHAWYAANAEDQTHPVATQAPDALGLHDMLGNVAELVAEWSTAPESPPVARGGSYQSPADEVGCAARMEQTSAWNATDPQLPKSQWWLADAPFVGFRLVREPDNSASTPE